MFKKLWKCNSPYWSTRKQNSYGCLNKCRKSGWQNPTIINIFRRLGIERNFLNLMKGIYKILQATSYLMVNSRKASPKDRELGEDVCSSTSLHPPGASGQFTRKGHKTHPGWKGRTKPVFIYRKPVCVEKQMESPSQLESVSELGGKIRDQYMKSSCISVC